MRTLFILALLFVLTLAPLAAEEQYIHSAKWLEVPIDASQIASQKQETYVCGYAAILNSLVNGSAKNRKVALSLGKGPNERVKLLVDTYGSRPSSQGASPHRQTENGIQPGDLRDVSNELRSAHGLPPLTATILERGRDETQKQLLTRIHGLLYKSLSMGEPPIILLDSYAAEWFPRFFSLISDLLTGANPMQRECIWNRVSGHAVTVIGLPDAVNDDGSFCIKYLDSLTGKKERLFLYNPPRDFTGYQNTANSRGWSKTSNFAFATGSTLDLNTSKRLWSERTEIFLEFSIYKE